MHKVFLKSIISALLVLVCLLGAVGCEKPTDDTTDGPPAPPRPITVKDIRNVNKEKNSKEKKPKMTYSFRDDDFYYYFFDLGQILRVPLAGLDGLDQYVSSGPAVTLTFTQAVVETNSITTCLSKTISETVEEGFGFSAKVSGEISIGGNNGVTQKKDNKTESEKASKTGTLAAEVAFSYTHKTTKTTTFTDSITEASEVSKRTTKEVKLTFDDEPDGFYGYRLTGAVEVFALLCYDIAMKEYTIEYFNYVTNPYNGFYYFKTEDEYVNYKYDKIKFTLPDNLEVPENYSESYSEGIAVEMTRYECKDDNNNGYDKSNKETAEDWIALHDGYELGDLMLYGCSKAGNKYIVDDASKFSIKFHLLEDVTDLPKSGGAKKTWLSEDVATTALGTNIDSKIGYGAYWVRVTYSDDSQAQYNATNIFKEMYEKRITGAYIEMVGEANKIDTSKKLKTVEVVVVYELRNEDKAGLFNWWGVRTPNWRCEYTFDFATAK